MPAGGGTVNLQVGAHRAAERPAPRATDPRDAELEDLRGKLRRLVDEAAENEKRLKRAQERQLELLGAETLPELFGVVTQGLATSYQLDAVTLVLEKITPSREGA